MKKLITLFAIVLLFATGLFSQSKYEDIPEPIWYAINDDYISFEKYVKNGGDLNVSTTKGMNLPISLGYFSNQNFKKAISLLKSKKCDLDLPNKDNYSLLHFLCYGVKTEKIKALLKQKPDINRKTKKIGLSPVQMTQYSTYVYYENQIKDLEAAVEKFNVQQLLMGKEYYMFKHTDVTYGYYGNFLMLLFNSILAFRPDTLPDVLFNADLTESGAYFDQKMETVTFEKMNNFYNSFGLNPEITEYKDSAEIKSVLKECQESDDNYILFIQTGNNPLAPFHWASVLGFRDEDISDETLLFISTPDINLGSLEYRVKDISHLITIKVQP